MNKRQLASWLVSGTLVVGGGIALAETGPDDPTVSVDETTTTLEATTTTTVDATTTTTAVEATTTTTAVDVTTTTVASGGDGEAREHPDNHGAVVSEAAHRHDMDEACGNHGRWVSSVAKGEDQCAALAGDEEADEGEEVADTAETTDGHRRSNTGRGSKG